MRKIFVSMLMFALFGPLAAQQIVDTGFDPLIAAPRYRAEKGPVVLVDEAHHNFHTASTRYSGFASVLTRDGYRVKPSNKPFDRQALQGASLLVIANAIHASNVSEWTLPTPSAFTPEEIQAVAQWVTEGGSLLLIADHMPFPGAAHDLARAFGFTFYNGFATDTTAGLYPGAKRELDVFQRSNGTLARHTITHKQADRAAIDRVATFTGQAFQIPEGATSLLTFDARYIVLLPDTAWKFNTHTRRVAINGFSQGAVTTYGKGRVAVFGEAAMFTAQLKGTRKQPFGLNSPDAPQNLSFLLNLIQWLCP